MICYVFPCACSHRSRLKAQVQLASPCCTHSSTPYLTGTAHNMDVEDEDEIEDTNSVPEVRPALTHAPLTALPSDLCRRVSSNGSSFKTFASIRTWNSTSIRTVSRPATACRPTMTPRTKRKTCIHDPQCDDDLVWRVCHPPAHTHRDVVPTLRLTAAIGSQLHRG